MAGSSVKVEMKQKSKSLSKIWMIVILVAFLFPHLMLLLGENPAHTLFLLINGQFQALCVGLSLGCLTFVSLKAMAGIKVKRATIYYLWLMMMGTSFLAFSIDTTAIYRLSKEVYFSFALGLGRYWSHVFISYVSLWVSAWLLIGIGVLTEGHHKPLFGYVFVKQWGLIAIALIPFNLILPLLFCAKNHLYLVQNMGSQFLLALHLAWLIQNIVYIIVLNIGLKQKELNRGFISQQLKIILTVSGLVFAAELLVFMKFALITSHGNTWPYHRMPTWKDQLGELVGTVWPVIALMCMSYILWRYHHGKSKLGEDEKNISGDFGSARFATRDDLKSAGLYNENSGPLLGIDNNGLNLYAPLVNKLVISPPGGGKTTVSSIPLLLQHDGPVFAFDVKGELWAVTSSYRQKTMGRQVIAIDPFKIIQQKSFAEGKDPILLHEYHINPFDWLPKDPQALDRVINAFAASFLISSDLNTSHFDENAKILLRGYIDYLVRGEVAEKSLPAL
ncbi:MAG: type IV secretory system conjugative DNA transfer family protein, partial [Gammaproteobacteria bacterium]|nr:type IV secretory system conjugative DNA transfer family protein [Gammaproteobacteria bacterium]